MIPLVAIQLYADVSDRWMPKSRRFSTIGLYLMWEELCAAVNELDDEKHLLTGTSSRTQFSELPLLKEFPVQ